MKILIIDDEMMIREWLKHTLSTLSFDISLLDTASNGLEALKKVKEQNYELIFLDITMPKMNGIEFLKEIYELALDSMLIVLSSHDEFQYVREALRYNVKEYVLKNECSKEKLTEILDSCQDKLLNQHSGSDLTEEFMERILYSTIPSRSSGIISSKFAHTAGKMFFVAALEAEKADLRKYYENSDCQLRQEGLIGQYKNLSFYLFTMESKSSSYHTGYAELLYEQTGKAAGCGKICRDPQDILYECRNSRNGYQSLFYSEKKYVSGKFNFTDFPLETVEDLCEAAISRIRAYEKENTLTAIKDINAFFERTQPTEIESVIHTYQALLDTFFIYNNIKSRNVTRKLNTIRAAINSLKNFRELSNWALQTISSKSELNERNLYSSAVEKALEYIESDFRTISHIMEIADHVNLSLDYFSRLFKKETGETLNSYLIDFRMEKASAILISSNLSIQEVAERVGIENGSYFSKCFKKKFHTQPIQFRIQTKQAGNKE